MTHLPKSASPSTNYGSCAKTSRRHTKGACGGDGCINWTAESASPSEPRRDEREPDGYADSITVKK